MSWLLVSVALAADPVLLTQAPVLGDDASTATVHLHVPGLQASDRLKVSPSQGEVLEVQRQGELVTLSLRPPTARREGDDMPLTLKVRGSMKLDFEMAIPLHQPTRGSLEVGSDLSEWKSGSRAPVPITLKSSGSHAIPDSARKLSARASQGTVTDMKYVGDGIWTANWRPPSRSNGESAVLIAVTDLSAPEVIHGLLNIPVQGAAETASSPVLIAPFAPQVAAGSSLRIWVAAPAGEVSIEGALDLRNEGLGWHSMTVPVPSRVGAWTLSATGPQDKDSLGFQVGHGMQSIALRSDPPLLGSDTRSLSVTASVSEGGRASLVRLTPSGATNNGSPKNSGTTQTQRYRVSSSSNRVVISAAYGSVQTGLPASELVAWTPQAALPNDGKTKNTVILVAVDALGLPVKNVDITLKVPIGDARVQPTAKTDARGMVRVELTSGLESGPVRVLATSKSGLETELVLWQGVGAPNFAPSGDALNRDLSQRLQGASPVLVLPRIEGSVGKPSALLVSTNPSYTTPGAAVLISIRVQDAQGLPVAGGVPRVTPSIGKVGPLTDNGDGSYLVPVQLPPGQDGPLTIEVKMGDALGSVSVPSLQSLGGVAALDSSGQVKTPEPGGSTGSGGGRTPKERGPSEIPMGTVRVSAVNGSYRATMVSSGLASVPLQSSFDHAFPLGVPGVALNASLFPSQGNVGIDLRARVGVGRLVLGAGPLEEVNMDFVHPSALGVRFRTLGQTVRVGGGAWAHVHDALIFSYADDIKATAAIQNELLFGLRLGAILEVDTPTVGLELLVAETFGPLPQATHASLNVDLKLFASPAFVTLGVDLDLQHTQIEVADDTVELSSQQIAAKVGVGRNF